MTASQKEHTPAQHAAQLAAQLAGRIEAQLDAALEDSFPASDPVSFVTSGMEDYWRTEDGTPATPPPKDSDLKNKPKAPQLGPPIR